MIGSKHSHRSATIVKFLLLACLVAASSVAFPQAQSTDDPQTAALRKQALQLYRESKFVDAMPLLEKLSNINPSDFVVQTFTPTASTCPRTTKSSIAAWTPLGML